MADALARTCCWSQMANSISRSAGASCSSLGFSTSTWKPKRWSSAKSGAASWGSKVRMRAKGMTYHLGVRGSNDALDGNPLQRAHPYLLLEWRECLDAERHWKGVQRAVLSI